MLERGHVPTPDPAHGTTPEERPLPAYLDMGIINLDKPAGPSTHQVAAWVRDALEVERTGPGGTLDPGVTGVLPVAVGSATRVIKTLLDAPKEYVGVFEAHDDVDEEALRATFRRFVGPIWQMPPKESAVKRELRVREIYDLDVTEVEGRRALFHVTCEAGTYVRKLCHDVGALLLVGGHMRALRRLRTGPFHEDASVTLHDIRDAVETWRETADDTDLRRVVRPVEEGTRHLPRVELRDGAVDAVCHGANLAAPGVARVDGSISEGDVVVLMTLKGELVATARAAMSAKGMVEAKHGVAASPGRVIMERGTYPRTWGSD